MSAAVAEKPPLLEPDPEIPCGPWEMGAPWPELAPAPHKYRCMTCGLSSHFADKRSRSCKRGMKLVRDATGRIRVDRIGRNKRVVTITATGQQTRPTA